MTGPSETPSGTHASESATREPSEGATSLREELAAEIERGGGEEPSAPNIEARETLASEALAPGPEALVPETLAPEPVEHEPLEPKAPPSFSPTARAEWDNVPRAVREAIAKREREIDAGFRRYSGLGQFMKLAQEAGTSLSDALSRYVAAEHLLDTDPVKGILALCQSYKVDPKALAAERLAAAPLTAAPLTAAPPASGLAPPASGIARELASELAGEIGALQDLVLANQQSQALAEVDSFFNDVKAHPFIETVAGDMARLLRLGAATDLQEAYEAACWSNAEVRGRLINAITTAKAADQAARARATADQARTSGQSITGGPAATPPPGPPESDDLREQLKEAFASARLA